MAFRVVRVLFLVLLFDVCVNNIHARRNKHKPDRRPKPGALASPRWVFKDQAMPCRDTAGNCRNLFKYGWCSSYRGYMMRSCKMTCGFCIPIAPEACMDTHEQCALWARLGHCEKRRRTMRIYCTKSCGKCEGSSRPQPSTCVDRHRFCKSWASKGECRRNWKYMRPNCARACGYCKRVTVKAIDGDWGVWGTWEACSKTCGNGLQSRTRTCDNPRPQNGGKQCVGNYQQSIACNLKDCVKAIDGDWGVWGTWKACSKTCGNGLRSRTRTCNNPRPQNGGKYCVGNYRKSIACNLKDCAKAIDGKWGSWGPISSCSKSCGDGLRTRTRACDNPRPQNGGKYCVGLSRRSFKCNLKDCVKAVDGQWGSWSHAGCSVTCGSGTSTRLRRCDNPAPKNGGKGCVGDSVKTTKCTVLVPCTTKVDGKWSKWGRWSSCSRTCNGGFKTRYRDCNNPPPSIDGRHCAGDDYEKISCNIQRCEIRKILPPFTCGKGTVSRIVGGTLAKTSDWPWQVGLKRGNDDIIFCGGSLINREWVLTAAHCIYRLEPSRTGCVAPDPRLRVVLGEFDVGNVEGHEIHREVAQVCMHSLYSHRTLDYDIALLRLKDPVMSFNEFIKPVCIPTSSYVIPIGSNCTVTGFGRTGENADLSNKLRQANVPIKQLNYCKKQYPNKLVTDRMVCAGYEGGQIDSCKGDSGGPFVCKDKFKYVLAGAVSWGVGCARAGQPGLYTNIKYLLPWIQKTMKDN